MTAKKPKMGRPTLFTDELALEICERIANGRSLRSVCLDKDMPAMSTVMDWLNNNDDFSSSIVERAKTERPRTSKRC